MGEVIITVDPLKRFPGIKHQLLMDECGYIPEWAIAADGTTWMTRMD